MTGVMVEHDNDRNGKTEITKPFKDGTYPRLSSWTVHFFAPPTMFLANKTALV
jgi:hypothetical protein